MASQILTSFVSVLLAIPYVWGPAPLPSKRKPLAKPTLARIEHEPTGRRIRLNPKTQQPEEYAVDGKIVYDSKTGNFLLQWNGRDGQPKQVIYEPATKLDVVVEARVEFDEEERLFRYAYSLWNLESSGQKLQSFYLETHASLNNVESPDPGWYSRGFTDYLRKQFRADGGWSWSDTEQGRLGMSPGQKVQGFSFLSRGLPSVVKCYVRHYASQKGVGEELPEELHAAIDRVAWEVPSGPTVGPMTPPERIQSATFLDRMTEMVDVSLQQGWITSAEFGREVQQSLREAREAFQSGNREAAQTLLRRLLARVEQEKKRLLLSEAYALLKFNLQFAVERFSE